MGVYCYDTKVQDVHGNKREGNPDFRTFFGVELEYEIDPNSKVVKDYLVGNPLGLLPDFTKISPVAHYVADKVWTDIATFTIIKRDGSLKNGVEVVSIPMSREAHREKWKPFFEKSDDSGLMVRANCGMHVHVSREYMTPLQIGKMLKFLHDPSTQELLKLVGGRVPSRKYANSKEKKEITDYKKHHTSTLKKHRRDALNITGKETVEFRFPKSTLSYGQFMTVLEFCAALVAFTWPSREGISDITLPKFLNFVRKRKKDFDFLGEFLKTNGLIETKTRSLPELRQLLNTH